MYEQLKPSQETVPCAAAGVGLVIVIGSLSGSVKFGETDADLFRLVVSVASSACGGLFEVTST